MSEDMSDMMKKISGMINSGNIPDGVMDAINNLKNNSNNAENSSDTSSDNNGNSGISPEMIQNIASMFGGQNSSNNTENSNNSNSSGVNIDMATLLKMKSIIDKMNNSKDDPRSNLLLSLKPYLKKSRKDKVEQYVKLLNMSKVMEVINPNGGDKPK